ncbi:MAG: GNAT family N-acyltransferase [Betaproteobacteria bacterium]
MTDISFLARTSTAHPTSALGRGPARSTAPRLQALWARHEDEVRAAQRLRHRVFAQEMGARLTRSPDTPPGHDIDIYDRFCEHLLIRTVATDHQPGEVVGTYRLLTPGGARLVGGLYTDAEFDLVRLRHLRPRIAELGRSCIDERWRTGGVIMLLWSSLAEFMSRNGLDVMLGCASVPMRDGGHLAASLWAQLRQHHMAPIEHHVRPRLALPVDELDSTLKVDPPPLIKGYLNCGAKVLGAPAWDPDFGTADLPMMLQMRDMSPAYRRRLLGA